MGGGVGGGWVGWGGEGYAPPPPPPPPQQRAAPNHPGKERPPPPGGEPDDNPTIGLLICKSKDQTKVEWAFDGIQNPMGVATYQGVKIVDKLPSIQALQERIKLLEEQLKESVEEN